MLGGIGGKRRRGRQRTRWLDGITDSVGINQPIQGDAKGKAKSLQMVTAGMKLKDTCSLEEKL